MLSASVCLVRGYKGECHVLVTQCLVTLYRYKISRTFTRVAIVLESENNRCTRKLHL